VAGSDGMGERVQRSPKPFHVLAELAVVGGLSLLAILWIIPNQTADVGAYGLSPSMMPTICAAAIAGLALLQGGFALLRRSEVPGAERAAARQPSMIHALLIVAAAVAGTFVLAHFGLMAGGIALAALVSFAIGERRLAHTLVLCCAVAAVMLLVDLSGL
jgi:nitrate reductase gamma subunit